MGKQREARDQARGLIYKSDFGARRREATRRPVEAIDPETSAVVRAYDAVKDAEADGYHTTQIRRAIESIGTHRRLTHGGFFWRYVQPGAQPLPRVEPGDWLSRVRAACATPVESTDPTTGETRTYPSMSAAKADGHDAAGIHRAINRQIKHHHGLTWRALPTPPRDETAE